MGRLQEGKINLMCIRPECIPSSSLPTSAIPESLQMLKPRSNETSAKNDISSLGRKLLVIVLVFRMGLPMSGWMEE